MQERRKYPRISVDLPVMVHFSHQHAVVISARMIELSREGVRFLCTTAPEIHSEVELRFSLPSENQAHEIRLTANVRYMFDALDTPGTNPDYRYMVGVHFKDLQKDVQGILERVMMKAQARLGS